MTKSHNLHTERKKLSSICCIVNQVGVTGSLAQPEVTGLEVMGSSSNQMYSLPESHVYTIDAATWPFLYYLGARNCTNH